MTRLFIPQIGNELKLTSNWDCKVFGDRLNATVFKALNIEPSAYKDKNVDITFPKGTVLKVDRLYVRAPASSYDSITFRISSCPMKGLNKARFFVKLMDANKIEFEEIVQSIGAFKKLKDSYRFVALSNEFKNSEHLTEEESTFVSKILYDAFKGEKEITLKFNVPVENIFNTIKFERTTWVPQEQSYAEKQARLKQALEFRTEDIPLVYHVVPALDGFISYFEVSKEAGELADIFGINNKLLKNHYGRFDIHGTPLAREVYTSEFAIKIPEQLSKFSDDQDQVEITYQGNVVPIKSFKELQKFLKTVRSND